jgi:S1-C subfamily serine protease
MLILVSGVAGAAIGHAVTPSSRSQALGSLPSSGSSGSGGSGLGSGSGSSPFGSGSDPFGQGSGSSGTGSGSSGSANAPAGVNTSAIASRVDPGLVDIDTTLADGGAAAGTGMVLTSSGLVLTNNHVIENATSINAQVIGGATYTARVLGYSVTDDVALLQLQGASGLSTITTGSSSTLSVGQPVVAIGNAGGTGGTPTAVAGTVTALDQTITAGDSGTLSETLSGLVETDADIQPGDSGGPLVNTSGQVVGMDTAASSTNGESTNQGYAIGINQALSLADQIKAGRGSTTVTIGSSRALLGVEVSGASGSQQGGFGFSPGSGGSGVDGAYVAGVQSGSPADDAGIATGDTIVSIDGSTVSSAQDLTNALLAHSPGDTVTVGWVDAQGASHSASVQLTQGPPA